MNSLRTKHGSFELGANFFQFGFVLLISLGTGIGLGLTARDFAANHQLENLALLLWSVLAAWQVIPFAMPSSQENIDLSFLLRFPVSFRVYFALYIFFGIFDFSSLVGGIALLGMWVGIFVARPGLLLWAAVSLALFGAFNLLLARTVFAWVNRWLGQRKTREVLALVFFFSFLGVQFFNPVFHSNGRDASRKHPLAGIQSQIERAQRPLPPALAAESMAKRDEGHVPQSLGLLGWMVVYMAGITFLLGFRLRAEYSGEQLSDGPRKSKPLLRRRSGEHFEWVFASGTVSALLEKELRYLFRSGAMLYSLAAPPILVFLFGGMQQSGHGGNPVKYALPLGVAYGFLGLTRFISNSLGGEAAGIQLYFLSPMPFRMIMLAKNLFQISLFCGELILVCAIVWIRFGMPEPVLIAATFCWLIFALPLQLALGNILSVKMAYRMSLTRMSRESGSVGNALMSLLIQVAVATVGAGIFFYLSYLGKAEWAAPAFLILAVGAIFAWARSLISMDRLASDRREDLLDALART